jgi:3-oxoacyl-[acyl-carrier-protein] synthase III
MRLPIEIKGVGVYLPPKIVDNSEMEARHQLAEGTIYEALGIKQRRKAVTENIIDMGAAALQNALDHAGYVFEDLDLLINASVSYAYVLPNTAIFIQKKLGKSQSGVPCMDVNQSCLSWLAAFDMAAALIAVGKYRRVAIVSAEKSSPFLNPDNFETSALFGDVAAAVIIEKSERTDCGVLKSQFATYSDGWNLSWMPAGGQINSPLNKDIPATDYMFQMQNRRLLIYTIKKTKDFLNLFFKSEDVIPLSEIKHIVPHQTSRAGLDFLTETYQLEGRVIRVLEDFGNCVAASIPLALCLGIQSGRIQKGDSVLLLGTAAGISVGAVLLKV